jgi:hypothetical protein
VPEAVPESACVPESPPVTVPESVVDPLPESTLGDPESVTEPASRGVPESPTPEPESGTLPASWPPPASGVLVSQALPTHVAFAPHVPQSIMPLQPSEMLPQSSPATQVVSGVHPQTLGLLGVPPPQLWGAVQLPQLRVAPHPFEMLPQLSEAGHDVMGTHGAAQMSS